MINLKLKDFQQEAVDFLLESTTLQSNRNIAIKSPTGSGKTIILIEYIERYLEVNKDTVFVWISPGKGKLEMQSLDKMKKFSPSSNIGTIEDVLISGFKESTTYFLNWEKITKSGNLAIKESEKNNLFDQIKSDHKLGMKFILIIDEEHLNNTFKASEINNALKPKYEIRVSATPSVGPNTNYYAIDEIDVINEGLITRSMNINYQLDVDDVLNVDSENKILIKKAEEIRAKIKKAYDDIGVDVNPLVLIQFPNVREDLIHSVENILSKLGYTYGNKMVASWFSIDTDGSAGSSSIGKINTGEVGSDDDITKNNASQRFLLFKQAVATGWDCPRAKILVKLRENMSENFEIQTLGRLRRMPEAIHYDNNDILNQSFLFTFDEKFKEEARNYGANDVQTVFLKEEARDIRLVKEFIDRDKSYADEKVLRNELYDFFNNKYKLSNYKSDNKQILENNGYLFEETILKQVVSGKIIKLSELSENNLKTVDLKYQIDTHMHGLELQHILNNLKSYLGLDYKRTRALFENLFRKDIGNVKYKLLNLDLKEFYSFIINNSEKISKDLEEYGAIDYEQLSVVTNKRKKIGLPLQEEYKYNYKSKNTEILEKNVYHKYNFSMVSGKLRSYGERQFEMYCEKSDKIKFIYRSKDLGNNYMSIVYKKNNNIEHLLYPDYVVETIDGELYIIESKGGAIEETSKNYDEQASNKFNALKKFANENGYKFAFIRDIDENLYFNNTEYTEDMYNDNWEGIDGLFL